MHENVTCKNVKADDLNFSTGAFHTSIRVNSEYFFSLRQNGEKFK